jgi:hypothetical protein
MGTYKVIQDIEAEDKLLGPLTLKQFIYAGIFAALGYVGFFAATKGLTWALAIVAPPMLFFGFLAFPWGKDQPTEVWLLAKLRFLIKPHRRIWDQTGMKELVTITAPKREEHIYTDGLSQTEVKSRLRALADTIDSRGWVVKNVDVNLYSQPLPMQFQGQATDRLVDPTAFPQEVVNYSVTAEDDILDVQNNPTAQHLGQMMQASTEAHKQQLAAQLQNPQPSPQPAASSQQPASPNDYWFLSQTPQPPVQGLATFTNSPVVMPGVDTGQSQSAMGSGHQLSDQEQQLLEELHRKQNQPNPSHRHMRTIKPLGDQSTSSSQQSVSRTDDDDDDKVNKNDEHKSSNQEIMALAGNDDLNVETIARQAQKAKQKEADSDEVVISLH